jgi:hypothetical protein
MSPFSPPLLRLKPLSLILYLPDLYHSSFHFHCLPLPAADGLDHFVEALKEDAVLAPGDGFDGLVDGDSLVIARLLAAAVFEIVLEENLFLFRRQSFPRTVFPPKVSWRGKGFER